MGRRKTGRAKYYKVGVWLTEEQIDFLREHDFGLLIDLVGEVPLKFFNFKGNRFCSSGLDLVRSHVLLFEVDYWKLYEWSRGYGFPKSVIIRAIIDYARSRVS